MEQNFKIILDIVPVVLLRLSLLTIVNFLFILILIKEIKSKFSQM